MHELPKSKESIAISRTFLRGLAKDTFLVIAKGHGMMPDIKSKDWLICVKSNEYVNGDIVILYNGIELHCKYYLENDGGMIFLNGKKEIFDGSEYDIVGKVLSKITHL